MTWNDFRVYVKEEGYIAIECTGDGIWDQFPLGASGVDSEGIDLFYLVNWSEDHNRRYHSGAVD